ncbi:MULTISPECIES: glycosyltransferase family 2 protein [unclassified Clostridium]|uniref:glycosyltransferase family 2 protein n=1 Tax=unclassified Clostridium TaxID=2614128 RepID=UPI00029731B2|nr:MULTISPECIES: glycosyltransferase family 2 protein [unclassified Clostridium]EKQ55550.1 MAG: glycosyl transferase [Clostridium sp. Maddingley MBC34-26]
MNFKVSVIVPVYKVRDRILRTLECLKAQTLKEFEVLFIDDGSPDNSSEFAHNYLKDSHVIYRIIKKENGGVSSARNLGIEEAVGEYIQFLDSDDYIDKDMLKDLYNKAIETNSDIVYTGYVYEEADGTKILDNIEGLAEGVLSGKEAVIKYIYGISYTPIMAGIFKRSLLIDNNIKFNTNRKFAEDIAFAVKAYCHSQKVYCCKKIYFHYVKWEGSAMNSMSLDYLDVYYSNLEILEYIKENFNYLEVEKSLIESRIPAGIVNIFIGFAKNENLHKAMYDFIKQKKVREDLSKYKMVKIEKDRIKYLILSKMILYFPKAVVKYYSKK